MNVTGIIGGLGPETTAQFYLRVVFACSKKNEGTRPPMLMWNVPIPVHIEEDFIKHTQGKEVYLPLLIDAAQRLERGGADFIVIPCNSVHLFIEQIRQAVKIPVLSIVEETIKQLLQMNVQEVGILATSVTLREKLYETHFDRAQIRMASPTDEQQAQMGDIINNLVQQKSTEKDKQQLLVIVNSFVERGVKTIVLACTDLQLLLPSHKHCTILDSMEILAASTINRILL